MKQFILTFTDEQLEKLKEYWKWEFDFDFDDVEAVSELLFLQSRTSDREDFDLRFEECVEQVE